MSADYFPPSASTSSGASDGITAGEVEGTEDPSDESAGPDVTTTTGADETGTVPAAVQRVRLTVRTSTLGGTYQPRNVGAVWIEDAGGGFVKTLEKWGTIRDRWLGRWREASDRNVVDAITGATLAVHETHEATWNLTDVEGHGVEPGAYVVLVEITDRSGPGDVLSIRFDTSQGPVTSTPTDTEHFHDLSLVLE